MVSGEKNGVEAVISHDQKGFGPGAGNFQSLVLAASIPMPRQKRVLKKIKNIERLE
jgi:hypothetical protein